MAEVSKELEREMECMSISDRNMVMKILNHSKAKNDPEWSVFAFKHDTVNLSFMYTATFY